MCVSPFVVGRVPGAVSCFGYVMPDRLHITRPEAGDLGWSRGSDRMAGTGPGRLVTERITGAGRGKGTRRTRGIRGDCRRVKGRTAEHPEW
ncbi:periplasmic murein peptide-binding protein [Streptomyces lydicamycinicus]|uniref:Periplasmic murein peptide-binding protein n=1 Tax=Streptomyces lydicamycinicus TaxID=1546107 RepID=A0A0P4RHA6_9ACTN|nr:periplasmic murein peptide-binding protein [Streptomyces lydicamycinicus]